MTFTFELINSKIKNNKSGDKLNLFEVGCGTGSTIMPLHEKYIDQMNFFACDFSPNAVELLIKQDICELAFVKDLVREPIDEIENEKLDIITVIFMLSAIHPNEHVSVM